MNKITKMAMITGVTLCVAGIVLSAAGYFAGGKDFTYASDHVYVSGEKESSGKDLAVMEKQQIDAFTKLNVDFQDLDLDIRTSGDDHYYMEYKLEKSGNQDPLTWENKDDTLTMQETSGGKGSYYIRYDLGSLVTGSSSQKQEEINTVILYVPKKAQLSEAKIQLADGDLTADQLLCKNLTAKFSDGDMTLDQGVFENFEANFGDSDVKIKEIQCTKKIQLKSDDGDIILEKADIADGVISLVDGDLKMNHSSLGGDVEISSSDGDVSIQMESGSAAKTDIHLKTTDGDIVTDNLPQGKSGSKEDTSVYENKVDGVTATLNVKCGDGDITLSESAK